MKIFLSALENGASCVDGTPLCKHIVSRNVDFLWNLMSYFYIKNKKDIANTIKQHSKEIMIDSGAHSFQKGKKVNWKEYTLNYANFIKQFDDDKVVGYFEMDVDNIIGYDAVLQLRAILESASNKIIPVWHKNRGIKEFENMCMQYTGRIIAITGFKNEDITDLQYMMFLKTAKKYNCKVHCLGMTRKPILDKVPFDYVDSSSWKQASIYGRVEGKKVDKTFSKEKREDVFVRNYLNAVQMQKEYYLKWRSVCKD